ncbi:hypothetical protein SH528x_003860 [Novipirellula sp. SH528]|uniref:hypothetical protein n=1 Tax=Novipirellula sp. SH528 TaxID=3454466 RepID=UPI003F9F7106
MLVGLIDSLGMASEGQEIEIYSLGTCSRPTGENLRPSDVNRGLVGWRFGADAAALSIDAQEMAYDYMARMLTKHVKNTCTIVRFPFDDVPAHMMNYLGLDDTREESMDELVRQLQLVLGQPKSGFNLRRVMDDGGILLCNLSKGRLGEDSANLLGALLLSSLQLAGESRANIPESERRDFVCYVDELQNYSTTALATSLSEARKYRAPLFVMANQYREQLAPELRSAIIGNCGSVVTFQVGSEDAPFWSQHFGGKVSPENLMTIPKYHAVANILIDGMLSGPMTIRTLPPPHSIASRAEKIKRHALRQFARPREALEQQADAMFQ